MCVYEYEYFLALSSEGLEAATRTPNFHSLVSDAILW